MGYLAMSVDRWEPLLGSQLGKATAHDFRRRLRCWLGSMSGEPAGWPLQSGGATIWALQTPLVRVGHRLCLLAEPCLWFNTTIGQNFGLCHTNTPYWVESQALLPHQTVSLGGFCIQ